VHTRVAAGPDLGRALLPQYCPSVLAARGAVSAALRAPSVSALAVAHARRLCALSAGRNPHSTRTANTRRASVAGRPAPARCPPPHPYGGVCLPDVGLPVCRHHGQSDPRTGRRWPSWRTDHIQDFVCQACGHRVSARWGTALFQLKTPPSRIGEVLSALPEGLSVGAAVRVFGQGEATITRWRDRAAEQAARLHHQFVRDLHLPHVQLGGVRPNRRKFRHAQARR